MVSSSRTSAVHPCDLSIFFTTLSFLDFWACLYPGLFRLLERLPHSSSCSSFPWPKCVSSDVAFATLPRSLSCNSAYSRHSSLSLPWVERSAGSIWRCAISFPGIGCSRETTRKFIGIFGVVIFRLHHRFGLVFSSVLLLIFHKLVGLHPCLRRLPRLDLRVLQDASSQGFGRLLPRCPLCCQQFFDSLLASFLAPASPRTGYLGFRDPELISSCAFPEQMCGKCIVKCLCTCVFWTAHLEPTGALG